MKLSDNNALKCAVDRKLKTNIDMYYNPDKYEIVIYLSDITTHLKDRIKAVVLDYISKNDMHQAYEAITIYS